MQLEFITRDTAAAVITSMGLRQTAQGLADMAHDGVGPPYSIVRGRALYRREDIETWLRAEFERGARTTAAA
jgi:hypothetical protein